MLEVSSPVAKASAVALISDFDLSQATAPQHDAMYTLLAAFLGSVIAT
jgi:hypothetical protein